MRNLIIRAKSHIVVSFLIEMSVIVTIFAFIFGWYLRDENYKLMMNNIYKNETAIMNVVNNNVTNAIQPMIDFGISNATSNALANAISAYENGRDPQKVNLNNLMKSWQYPVFSVAATIVGPSGIVNEYDIYRGNTTGTSMWTGRNTEDLVEIYNSTIRQLSQHTEEFPRYYCYTEPSAHPVQVSMRVFHLAIPVVFANGTAMKNVKYVLVYTIKMSIFDNALEMTRASQSGKIISVIADGTDHVIYSKTGSLIGATISDVPSIYQDYGKLQMISLRCFGWKIGVYLNENAIRASVEKMYRKNNILFMLLLCAFIVFAFLYTQRILGPVSAIRNAMQRLRTTGQREEIPVRGTHEIWQLTDEYNRMLRSLRNEELEADRQHAAAIDSLERAYDAEREALESQINAHFICNTINVINYEAIDAGDDRASILLKKLSNILRYTFDCRVQDVFITQEAAWTEQYLYLQKERFENLFDYSVEIDETYEDWPACKLMLQPFVENSILHGFDEMKSGGFIRVSTFMEDGDDRLCLAIEDNGRGMPECERKFVQSVISDLRAGIRRPDKNRQGSGYGVGVQNVLIRMWSFYGTGMGVELVTAPGKGTKYLFRLPYPKEKEGDSCGS